MKGLAARLFVILVHLGAFGLLALGVLDSSFLVMPLGNDLLVIGLAARRHLLWPWYALVATTGSVLGCLLVDVVCRKGGEEVLSRHIPPSQLKFVDTRVRKSAGWALGFAALMPPPFPFTPFVIAAAVFEYPRRKLLGVIAATRFLRFAAEAFLATIFGRSILHWFSTTPFQIAIFCLIAFSIVASVLSVYSWLQHARQRK